MTSLIEELGIPKRHLKETSKQQRFSAVVHKSWLKSLIKHLELIDFLENPGEIWPASEEEINSPWMKIFITILKKRNCKVIPLPRIKSARDEEPLLFPQLMQYIAHTNHVGLWKEAYKKYHVPKQSKETLMNLTDYNKVLKDVICRIYGCPIINTCDPSASVENNSQCNVHLNILPVACAVETPNAIFLLQMPHLEYNLGDCVTFSPAILESSYTKSLFVIYQLLNVLKDLHERSLTLGAVSLDDIFVNDGMWIQVFPHIESNLFVKEDVEINKGDTKNPVCHHVLNHNLQCQYCGVETYDKVQVDKQSLEELCHLWIHGQISNFTYVSALNKLSGRVLGDPNCHYVFPWVTDFTSRCGKNWRDLKKSKYRLNKGDHQLDLTFTNSQSQVPHHVSDVLSPITYYVYMARRTPVSVLRKNVRTVWVPAEYPSSIHRMQSWTPDECIPEFYTDPNIFRSIHDDMEDLLVPAWASGPEDFIERHRRALESSYVAEKLHHWIDLTFGYKLSGAAAVKARNVCLNLVDGHENLTRSGLVQLFNHPHPPRNGSSPYWSKIPPKICLTKQVRRCRRNSSNAIETNHSEDERCGGGCRSGSGLSKMLSRSRSSLHEETGCKQSRSPSCTRNDSLVSPKGRPNESLGLTSQGSPSNPHADPIYLPKDYKPEQALEALEKKHAFFSKTFANGRLTADSYEKYYVANSAECFAEKYGNEAGYFHPSNAGKESINGMVEERVVCNYADIISTRRVKELKVLGCVIVEIFMANQLKSLGSCTRDITLDERLDNCLSVMEHSDADLPPCISQIVKLLLMPEEYDRRASSSAPAAPVTALGLPPPTAHLLLEPLLPAPLPFPTALPALYRLLSHLRRFEAVAVETDVLYHAEGGGDGDKAVSVRQEVGECKVKGCVRELEGLLGEVDVNTEGEIIGIVLPYVKQLMESPPTSVLAAWYLFEPLSRMLGPRKSRQYLLEPLLKLYENEPFGPHLPYLDKIARLYHHSYLLSLMVRLGLKCFLDKFVVALVEAVGGYKDWAAPRAAPLGAVEETSGGEEALPEEGVFEFEEEKDKEDQMGFLMDTNVDDAADLETLSDPDDDAARSPAAPPPSDGRESPASERGKPPISETSADSVLWLSHRLGPLLTARHLSRNLLKMLALCYVGAENARARAGGAGGVSVAGGRVAGDDAADSVLECLSSISGLYGEQIILYQYIPYMTEMILLCKKRLTPNLEGGLISCLALLKHIIPYFTDVMLMDQLQDVILKNIVHPIARLLNSTGHPFPSGRPARTALARKYLDVLYAMSVRIGTDMTKKYLVVPALQRFFLIFDKVGMDQGASPAPMPTVLNDLSDGEEDRPQSPPAPSEALDELRAVFTRRLAHAAYLPFARLVGDGFLQTALTNHARVVRMCREHEEREGRGRGRAADAPKGGAASASGSIGSNVALVGNRIDVQDDVDVDLLSLVRNRVESSTRHLRGNWLAYWEYEIGRSEKNSALNFKQIKLQNFVGHTQSVKCIYALDNENSFLSGSRDKTVKLWSLRSQGDGSTSSNCQWTYGGHKKSILSIAFVESIRLVASCDSVVHIWDPFMGVNLGILESAKYAPVNVLKSMPAPSTLVFAATTDGTVKIIDTRLLDYVQELKISPSPSGLIRSLAVSPDGRWAAVGQSSGGVTVLDARTGLVVSSWRAHEGEVLQAVACDADTLVTSSLDQTVCAWSAVDGKFKFRMRGTTEPVHCLAAHNGELISGSTANRIGVHAAVLPDAAFSSTKLRADTFRGLLTAMDCLPLNRLLLLGADTGNIHLLC